MVIPFTVLGNGALRVEDHRRCAASATTATISKISVLKMNFRNEGKRFLAVAPFVGRELSRRDSMKQVGKEFGLIWAIWDMGEFRKAPQGS